MPCAVARWGVVEAVRRRVSRRRCAVPGEGAVVLLGRGGQSPAVLSGDVLSVGAVTGLGLAPCSPPPRPAMKARPGAPDWWRADLRS